jgi:predicted Zn-dependent protease
MALVLLALAACTVNPATGNRQFTALMSSDKEAQDGAKEYKQISAIYGTRYDNTPLQAYLNSVGQKVAAKAERQDVTYRFFILDTPRVNAFALPGGYVYATRGLLALANSEDELAGVLAHEVGHIAGRHLAERYSQRILTSLGAAALAVTLGSTDASQALDIGANLLAVQYSRDQETEADRLGVRYLAKAGYDPQAMAHFLEDMDRYEKLETQLSGAGSMGLSDFFSTHPQTSDRVAQAEADAAKYPGSKAEGRAVYLQQIDGLLYGDGIEQGLIRGNRFYHPGLNVTFSVPAGFTMVNSVDKVIAKGPGGSLLLFDGAANKDRHDVVTYLAKDWLAGEKTGLAEQMTIGGHPAASAAFDAKVNGHDMKIRLIAVQWTPDRIFRFQIAMKHDASAALVNGLKSATFSLRSLTDTEKKTIRPYRIAVVTAAQDDTVDSLAARMAIRDFAVTRFRVLNGLSMADGIVPRRKYKIIAE